MQYERILAPIDDSELSDRVLDIAIAQAVLYSTELIIVWVRRNAVSLDQTKVAGELSEIDLEVKHVWARVDPHVAASDLPRSRVRVEVRAGNVADAIIEAAEESKPDLIVMGTHGRSGLGDAMMGSTTERVLGRTIASVFAVRPLGYPFLRE